MALHQTRKCEEFNPKFLHLILAGVVRFLRKKTDSKNVMSYLTSQIHVISIFYTQIGYFIKVQKKTFALSDFILLLVCHIGILVLNKNVKKPFVAICFGLWGKTLVRLFYWAR